MPRCFRVNRQDNVATMLDPGNGRVEVLGEPPGQIQAREDIPADHKVALEPIRAGEPVIKFGTAIGTATRDIRPGEWVHLHNCASGFDERSRTLDPVSGATTDTRYE